MPLKASLSPLPAKAKPPRTLVLLSMGIGFILLGVSELAVSHVQSHRDYSAKIIAMQAQDSSDDAPDTFDGCALAGLSCPLGAARN